MLDLSFNPADVAKAEAAGVDVALLRRVVRDHLDTYLAAAPDVPVPLPQTVEDFRQACPSLTGFEQHMRRTVAELLAELRAEAAPRGVRLMGLGDPSIDIVMVGAYGEVTDAISRITHDAKARLGKGQELITFLRMGFYGRPELGTAITTDQQMIAATQAVADAGADAIGFYNYAEAPRRGVDWIKPALQAVRTRASRT